MHHFAAEGAQAGAGCPARGEGHRRRSQQAVEDVSSTAAAALKSAACTAQMLASLILLSLQLAWRVLTSAQAPWLHSCLLTLFAVHLCCCSKVVRKSIARVLTVISHNQRAALKEAFKGKVGSSRQCKMVWPMQTGQLRAPAWERSGLNEAY